MKYYKMNMKRINLLNGMQLMLLYVIYTDIISEWCNITALVQVPGEVLFILSKREE